MMCTKIRCSLKEPYYKPSKKDRSAAERPFAPFGGSVGRLGTSDARVGVAARGAGCAKAATLDGGGGKIPGKEYLAGEAACIIDAWERTGLAFGVVLAIIPERFDWKAFEGPLPSTGDVTLSRLIRPAAGPEGGGAIAGGDDPGGGEFGRGHFELVVLATLFISGDNDLNGGGSGLDMSAPGDGVSGAVIRGDGNGMPGPFGGIVRVCSTSAPVGDMKSPKLSSASIPRNVVLVAVVGVAVINIGDGTFRVRGVVGERVIGDCCVPAGEMPEEGPSKPCIDNLDIFGGGLGGWAI